MPGNRANAKSRKGAGKRSGNRNRGAVSQNGPPASAIVYRGPARPRNESTGTQINLFRLSNAATVATSAGGIAGTYYPNDPSGVAEWSNFAAVFQEYRCIAVSVRFIPKYFAVATAYTTSTGEVCWYDIRSTAAVTPATTLALAYEFAGSRVIVANRTSSRTWRMSGTETSDWIPVSAPLKSGGVVFTVFDSFASTTIGNVVLDYLVQFRARQ